MKRLKFELGFFHGLQYHHIDYWLDAATPGIEELTLELARDNKMIYRFPCSVFAEGKGCSIRSLCLYACAFHPEQGSCSFRSLRRVHFSWAHITTEETGIFLSNSLTLEHLELWYCNEIACLRIPCTVQELSFLRVGRCSKLEVVESDAPNISTFHYEGPIIPFSLGDSQQLKDIRISIYPWLNLFDYARKKLPTIAPNVETLFLMSADEIGAFYNLWIVTQERLIHLRHLELAMVGPRTVISFHYRYLFLVPFLIACPALETFILHVCHICVSKCDLFLLLFSYFTLCFILANEFFLIFYLCRWSRLQ